MGVEGRGELTLHSPFSTKSEGGLTGRREGVSKSGRRGKGKGELKDTIECGG